MKKILSLTLSALLLFTLCACSGNSSQGGTSAAQNAASAGDTTLSTVAVTEDVSAAEAKSAKFKELEKYDVDIDTNGLNKNMLTAQMQAISQDPEKYLGKTIRLTATYQKQKSNTGDKAYNYAFGYDDTGCCAAWAIEFYGDKVPDNMEDFTSISMVGKISQYDEDGTMYTFIDVEHFAV